MKLKKKLHIAQNIISVEFKDDGKTYLFGSLAAIYSAFSADDVGITYESLRNASYELKKRIRMLIRQ